MARHCERNRPKGLGDSDKAFLEKTSGRTWKTIRQEDILQLRVAGRDEGFTF